MHVAGRPSPEKSRVAGLPIQCVTQLTVKMTKHPAKV
jgi:hypothetical protein